MYLNKSCLVVLLSVFVITAHAQHDSLHIDSLKKVLLTQKEDTNKVNILLQLGNIYSNQVIIINTRMMH